MKTKNLNCQFTKPMPNKWGKYFRIYCCLVMALVIISMTCTIVLADNPAAPSGSGSGGAASGDPITVVNNLSTFIFGLIRAVGLILLGWGIVQVGLSFQSHDPSQRSNGFLTLAGGVIITFAKEILDLIVV